MLNDAKGTEFQKIYIACGKTDLRQGIQGLASLIQFRFKLDPYQKGTIFMFCGSRKDRIKCLLWEGDGFLLLYKRLSNGHFCWPRNADDLKDITPEQFRWLMEGLTIEKTIHPSNPKYIG